LKEYLGRRGPKNWDPDAESERDTDFSYSSPFGMVRAGCDYCSAANGEAMQTPAAEGFKAACFHLVKECRLGRLKGLAQVVNEIHDETIVEVLAGEERLHEVAMIVKEVMEGSMAIVIKDVKSLGQGRRARLRGRQARALGTEDGRLTGVVYFWSRAVSWYPVEQGRGSQQGRGKKPRPCSFCDRLISCASSPISSFCRWSSAGSASAACSVTHFPRLSHSPPATPPS
jgi:hypothetical protein